MKKYKHFVNEGIRDKMTPISPEEVHRILSSKYYVNPEIYNFLVNSDYLFSGADMKSYDLSLNRFTFEFYNKEKDKTVYFYPGESLELVRNQIKPYRQYNESVRSKMTPKSEEDILDQSKKWEPWEILEYGADNGLMSLVQYAIDKGADINEFDSYAFRLAVFNNHINIAKLFIKHGADIHTLDDCLIIGVCEQGLIDMAKLLIKYGAKIHVRKGKPMKMAIKNGHTEIVKLLNRYDKTNESVRDMMTPRPKEEINHVINKSLNMFPKLGTFNYKKYGLNFMDGDFETNTFKMVDKEDNEWFMRLEYYRGDEGRITIYAPPNKLLKVHIHERFYSYKELEDYLDKIYNINESVKDMMTPKSEDEVNRLMNSRLSSIPEVEKKLELSATHGMLSLVKQFLPQVTEPKYLFIAFVKACVNGHKHIVEYLLDNVDNKILDKEWGMCLASDYGHYDVVKFLLDSGTGFKERKNLSILNAKRNNHYDVADLLMKYKNKRIR